MIGVLLTFGLFVGTCSCAWAAEKNARKRPSRLEKELATVCKETCDAILEEIKMGRRNFDEEFCEWSARWAKAEKAVRQKPDDLVAVYKVHWERMKDAEKEVKALHKVGKIGTIGYNRIRYYRIQAEIWFTEAKSKK
jgi:hypothetical protein